MNKEIMGAVRRALFILLPSAFIVASSGCAALGVMAYKLAPPPTIQPVYIGLAGQSVAVMVWADRGIRIDWPSLQLDLANVVQQKLIAEIKAKSVAGATYPLEPASIVRYQMDYPELASQPVTEVALALHVTRLIYIELDDFATRSDMSVDLYRGQAKGTVRVVEVNNGVAKVAFEEANVTASFPPKAPAEGVPNAGDAKIYAGTVDAFGTSIAHLFVPWQAEE